MCGRFTLTATPTDIKEAFPEVEVPSDLAPRFNIAPSQPVAVIANTGVNRVELYRWGLVPSWAKDPGIGDRLINARAETIAEKPSFRRVYRRRRCLVLADGFYEWRQEPGNRLKTPMYIRLASGRPFAFAGVWDVWRPPEGDLLHSCAIITTAPNALMQVIHNRMPVILPQDAYTRWLDPNEQPPENLDTLLAPFPADAMTAYPVSRFVNSPQNEGPGCIAAVQP
ncbi:MAG: SOS response-associated peptidase [Acidobacteria bacterium]|nr:SOS response-associated peptidase [Acidobacteriota bacterium]